LAKLILEEKVGGKVKELYRKIRRYQKMLERAYFEKKVNYSQEKLIVKKWGKNDFIYKTK
jgi:hypothetical protein